MKKFSLAAICAALIGRTSFKGMAPPTVKMALRRVVNEPPPPERSTRPVGLSPFFQGGKSFHPPMPTHRKANQRAALRLRNLKKHRAKQKAHQRRQTRCLV